jgi:hypothetical protein
VRCARYVRRKPALTLSLRLRKSCPLRPSFSWSRRRAAVKVQPRVSSCIPPNSKKPGLCYLLPFCPCLGRSDDLVVHIPLDVLLPVDAVRPDRVAGFFAQRLSVTDVLLPLVKVRTRYGYAEGCGAGRLRCEVERRGVYGGRDGFHALRTCSACGISETFAVGQNRREQKSSGRRTDSS